MKLQWEPVCNQWDEPNLRFRITSHIYLPANTTVFRLKERGNTTGKWLHLGTFPSLESAQQEAERLSDFPA